MKIISGVAATTVPEASHFDRPAPSSLQAYDRLKTITERLGVSRTWFLMRVQDGRLPKPVKLGPRMSLWNRAELDAAFASLVASHAESHRAAA